jgi:uncharacterized membrane protein
VASGSRTNLPRVKNRWSTNRIEAFSDGVIAIAITLLVLEISVPEESFNDLWQGIFDQWPSYLAYVTSFLTIGVIWFIHHGIFRRLAFADATITRLNLVLLMLIALLPFPTTLMAEAIDSSESERAAVIFYGLVLFAISAVLNLIWQHVARNPDLVAEDVSDEEVKAISRESAPNLAFYGVVVLVALIAPQIAAFGYLAIAVLGLFRSKGDYIPSRKHSESGSG